MNPTREWSALVAPMVERCELAAKLQMNATWNPDGAQALGDLLKRMATTLDDEIERQTQTSPNSPHQPPS